MTVAEILKKYAKKGDKLYSPMFGEVTFDGVGAVYDSIYICKNGLSYTYNSDGTWSSQGEPILFPSREQRSWEEYVKEKENTKQIYEWELSPGDVVRVKRTRTIIRVDVIDDIEGTVSQGYSNTFNTEDLAPIPITPEILKKLGYTQSPGEFGGGVFYYYVGSEMSSADFYIISDGTNYWFIAKCGAKEHIQYMHELQHTLRKYKHYSLAIEICNDLVHTIQ